MVARSHVLALLAAVLALGGTARGADTDRGAEPGESEPIVTKVGTAAVSMSELQALLDEARPIFRQRGRLFPAKNDPYYADLRDEAVRYLVERSLREQLAVKLGISVAEARRRDSLEVDMYRAISIRRNGDETVREVLARYREELEDAFAQVRYAPGYRPTEHPRSVPPELRMLPQPKARCDLKAGMYPFFVARAHGCLPAGDADLKYLFPPCPEIPASETIDVGLTDEEVDSGYAEYAMSGTAAHDFFEPLTTNKEDLTSEEDPEGPECQDFPGEWMVSVGNVGFRSKPSP